MLIVNVHKDLNSFVPVWWTISSPDSEPVTYQSLQSSPHLQWH